MRTVQFYAAIATALFLCVLARASAEQTASTASTYNATVAIGSATINVVNPLLFGDNIEWANEGMGIWRPDLHGFDPQIVALLKESGVRDLRYPGGTLSDYFHWYQAVGASRNAQVDPFLTGATQMPDFGPDEFMALCRTLGVKGSITLNAGTGTPQEAAAWVKYNAEHGFDVTPYEVGNEIYMVRPTTEAVPSLPTYKTAQQYVSFYSQVIADVAADSPRAKLGGIGIDDAGPDRFSYDPNWLAEITTALGGKMDFVAVHNSYAPIVRTLTPDPNSARYSDDDFAQCTMGASQFVQDNLAATESLIRSKSPSGRDIPLHITESGPLVIPIDIAHRISDLDWNRSLAGALYEACLLNVFCRDPHVESANHLPLCQGYYGALIGIDGSGPSRVVWRNVVFYVFRAYSKMAGRRVVNAAVSCPDYATLEIGHVPALPHVPCLDAGAYIAQDRKSMSLFLINRDISRSAAVSIVSGAAGYASAQETTLTGPSYLAVDTAGAPDTVIPTTRPISLRRNSPIVCTVPPHSLVEVDLHARP